MITLDYHLDAFVKAITNLFHLIAKSVLQDSDNRYNLLFSRLLDFSGTMHF